MSQIAAVVAWGRGASPAVTSPALATLLGPVEGREARVEATPGALLGCVAFRADAQPFRHHLAIDEAAGVAAVVDCRLDNRDELRSLLGEDESSTDAALILRAYRTWGDDLVTHLEGDFAGAIWNWERQRLLTFRDPLGVKPLFLGPTEGGLAVSSEVTTLLPLTAGPRIPDDHLIVEHLTWDYQSLDRTFWAGLRRLPGGHVAVAAESGSLDVRRYWYPPRNELAPSDAGAVYEQLRDLIFRSVRHRLDADGPVLVHLSGGVDSSAIVCVADRLWREQPGRWQRPHVASARYPGLACDEGPYIEAVTREIALPAHSWDGRSDEFPDIDVPSLAGPGMRAHRTDGSNGEFVIARQVGARTILSGNGGDQLGGPFGVGEEEVRRRFFRACLRVLRRSELRPAERARRLLLLLQLRAPPPVRRWVAKHRGGWRAPEWIRPRWRGLVGELVAARHADASVSLPSLVGEGHWRELTSARLGRTLDLDQHCASAHGIEVRYPFLDQRLVNFVLSLPFESWPSSAPHARLHRGALTDLLPAEVRARTDKALFSPIVAYRLRSMEGRLRELFFNGEWASDRWVDRGAARSLFQRALSGDGAAWDLWRPVRAVATLEAWLRAVLR